MLISTLSVNFNNDIARNFVFFCVMSLALKDIAVVYILSRKKNGFCFDKIYGATLKNAANASFYFDFLVEFQRSHVNLQSLSFYFLVLCKI